MGLNSLMLEASTFLGRRVMKAEFRSSKLANFMLQTAEIAAIISNFMVYQHTLLNLPEPRALSEGRALIVRQTSSSENVASCKIG